MFPSGSFTVFLAVFRVSKIQNEPEWWTENFPSWYILNVPIIPITVIPTRYIFRKIWEHCKHIKNIPSFAVSLKCVCSVPRFS